MSETSQDLSGVPETMLIPLYIRAMESQRPDALTRDERAVELVFHTFSQLLVWAGNGQIILSKLSARFRWGLRHGRVLEGWGDGIRLLDEWGFFDQPEPRLAHIRWWWRPIETLVKTHRIYHCQLGKAAG